MTEKLDIRTLPLDDLLAAVTDRDPKPETVIDTWVKTEGYYPGQTRVAASELYARFRKWAESRGSTPIPHQSQFGADMARRFRRGKSSRGKFYYISRNATPDAD